MEVSIYELLAAARESAKSDYIKGDSILCEKRFHPDTHYMVEIELLKNCFEMLAGDSGRVDLDLLVNLV